MSSFYFWTFSLLLITSIFGFAYVLTDKNFYLETDSQPASVLQSVQKNDELPPQCMCPYIVGDRISDSGNGAYHEIVTAINYDNCPGKVSTTPQCLEAVCGFTADVYNNGVKIGVMTTVAQCY